MSPKEESKGDEKATVERKILARVHDRELLPADVANFGAGSLDKTDSANLVGRYVRSWVQNELMIAEAEKQMRFDQAEIKRKIQEYRYALMVYEFEKLYINRNLDTSVSDEEIESYYERHKESFLLKQNILRAHMVHLPPKAREKRRFKKWMKSDDPADQQELNDYCFANSTNYHLQDSVWLSVEEALRNTPLASKEDRLELLMKKKLIELDSKEESFFMRVLELRRSDQVAPIDWVRDQIRKIILNKRKIALISALEEQIYKRAEKNNEFEIFETE